MTTKDKDVARIIIEKVAGCLVKDDDSGNFYDNGDFIIAISADNMRSLKRILKNLGSDQSYNWEDQI